MNAANSVGPWPARRNVLKLDIMVSVATPAEGRSGRHMNAHIVMSMTRSAEAKVGCIVTPDGFYARGVPKSGKLASKASRRMVRHLHLCVCSPLREFRFE